MSEPPPDLTIVSRKRFALSLLASIIAFLLTTYLGIIAPFAICVEIFGFDESRVVGLILLLTIPFVIGLPCAWYVFRSIKQLDSFLGFFKIAGVRFMGRMLRTIGLWGTAFLGMVCLSDFGPSSWSLKWIAFGTFNVPVLITLIRSYRLSKNQWDWWFLTFLILHANVVIALIFSKTWTPDVHFVKGLIFGQTLILVSLGICFLYRAIKGQMSIPRFVQYGLGGFAPTIVFFIVREHWVYSSYYV